nr:endonuclease/exonuclease/phosphatase family protein [Actinomadura sp. CNU-125]
MAREFHLLGPEPDLHRRGLAVAVLEIGGARFVAASTHLDLAAEPRRRHVREILDLLDRARERYGAPVVLAGDVNEEPGGPAWSLLAGRLRDGHAVAPAGEAATFSARNPRRRIDGVFADPDVDVVGCGVPGDEIAPTADYAAATDHRPVMAELRLRS